MTDIIDKTYHASNLSFMSRLRGNYLFDKKFYFFFRYPLDMRASYCHLTYLMRTNTLIC